MGRRTLIALHISGVTEYSTHLLGLIRLDVGRADDLAPLFGFFRQEVIEVM
jgi:hypothetical protein